MTTTTYRCRQLSVDVLAYGAKKIRRSGRAYASGSAADSQGDEQCCFGAGANPRLLLPGNSPYTLAVLK